MVPVGEFDVCFWYLRYFMALIQEMAVKIDQDFLAAMLALFTPVTDAQADRQKVKQGNRLLVQLSDMYPPSRTL